MRRGRTPGTTVATAPKPEEETSTPMVSVRFVLLTLLLSPWSALAQDTSRDLREDSTRNYKTELEMGDLPNNAFTLRGGTALLHPILHSGYGITDNLEVKTSILGLIAGPNVTLEYGLRLGENTAVSIEPGVSASWNFAGFGVGGLARVSQRLGETMYFNVNAGAVYSSIRLPQQPAITNVNVPVSASFNLQTSPHTIWDFRAGADVRSLLGPNRLGTVGFAWYHSFGGVFQLGLGLDLLIGGLPEEVISLARQFNVTLPQLVVFPLPDITFGFKF